MAKKPTKKSKSSSEKKETTENQNPDDALFVPHLDEMEFKAESFGGDEYAAMMESICGTTDDSQPVEQYDGTLGVSTAFVAAHQGAVCQVQWNDNLNSIYDNPGNVSGVRWGSGTMITDDIMLTCGHLFDQSGGGWSRPRVNGTTNIISPEEIARNMKCNFNFQVDPDGNMRTEQSFAIVELIEYRLGGLDMAICRVAGNPGATWGKATVSSTDAAPPDMICIMGHPAGVPKRIEAGPTTRIDGNRIRYNDIDTLGGNSGSGILRESDGKIVGVHTNGGCNAASPGPTGGSNFGLRIEAFIGASPTLQNLLRPKLKFRDDIAKFKFRDDVTPKLKVLDDVAGPKLKFRDDIPKFKFRDDVSPKFKFRDDQPPKRKFVDDVKSPALDKAGGIDNKAAGFDRPFDPGRFGRGGPGRPGEAQGGGQRPFILSTPHHSNAWQQQDGGEEVIAEMEAALMELEQAMEQASTELSELEAQYQELLAEYEAAATGQ